ncbi:MAG: VanZ family protein [Anaerolineales bacterium]
MKRFAILFAIFLAAVILLADLGYMEVEIRILNMFPFGDKIVHFLLIGILDFLLTASLIQTLPSRSPIWVAVSVAFFLAVVFTIEEASQGSIRGRYASWKDLFANYTGIIFFGFMAWFLNRRPKS